VDEQLAAAGVERNGPVDQVRVQAWSTVFMVPTTDGQMWFKAAGPLTSFEVPLYQLLCQLAPQYVLTPIAAHVTRGWILLPEGGTPLPDGFPGSKLMGALLTALPHYGQMQRDLARRAPDLVTLGVPDMRPADMPQRFDEALLDARRHVDWDGSEAERAAVAAVAGRRETVAAWCEQLAASPVAPSLDHGDLHPRNILVGEQVRFVDWGTSVVAHPFTSMLFPLRFVQSRHGVRHDDPVVARARDAYLESFSDLAPHAELVATLEAACRLGLVARAHLWASLGRDAGARGRGKQQTAFQWLTYLLEESYLGRIDLPKPRSRPGARAVQFDSCPPRW
jgi:hypothetical protein